MLFCKLPFMIAYSRRTVHVYILPRSDDRVHVTLHHLHDTPWH